MNTTLFANITNKKYFIHFIIIIITAFFVSCWDTFQEACNVTGKYKDYTCEEGFQLEEDVIAIFNLSLNFDSCQYSINSKGCGVVINNLESFFKFTDTTDYYLYNESDSLFWDFNTRTILGIEDVTGKGRHVYSSVFVCKNIEEKEVFVRCQYELSDQCAGSEISNLKIAYLLSIPKISADYNIIFSVENVNPLE